jgi:hypothetical protein
MGRSSYAVRLRWLNYPEHDHDAQTPVLVFVTEKGWFQASMVGITGPFSISSWFFGIKEHNITAPVVLDWAVPWPLQLQGPGGWTCSSGDATGGLCRSSNSYCVDEASSNSTRKGYVCKCQIGYQGNPYIRGGCQGSSLFACFCIE